MLMRWMWIVLVAFGGALPAWADEPTAQVTVGITRIELPVPAGFVEPTRALPQMQRYFLAQTLRQAEGRLIAQVQGHMDATARDMGREAGVTREWLPLAAAAN